jgi:PAT family beta-lactamase induction signal transducer AmpG
MVVPWLTDFDSHPGTRAIALTIPRGTVCVKSNRRVPPIWLMGLSNGTLGLTTGIVFFVMPQLLAAKHVSEAEIATITAAAMSANFWVVVFGPILDVRFSRRWYASFFAVLASVFIFTAVVNLDHLLVLEIVLTLAVATTALSGAALGGWLSAVCPPSNQNKLSAWINVALICCAGLAAAMGGELVRHLPVPCAAGLLGASLLLPTSIFVIIPAPGPDRRLAGESFSQFNREVLALLRRREVLIALLFFISPCSSFALTNILGGLGGDFHASARMVSLAGGAGAFFPGLAGCLLFPIFARRMPLRLLYLANGVVGGLFTLSLIVLPHAPWSFTLAVLGEFLFQAASYCIQIGIVFETIGQNNPLAATTFAFLTAATNIPVTYMMVADGRGYAMWGLAGSFAMDAGIGIAACLLLSLLLYRLPRKAFGNGNRVVEPLHALAHEE